MKNILGTQEDLTLYNKAGIITYKFIKGLSDDYYLEKTYNENGKVLTFKDSDGSSYEHTYDKNGNMLTYKNSNGYSWEKTYNENGKQLTYKDSDDSVGFDIPEFTITQVVEKIINLRKYQSIFKKQ